MKKLLILLFMIFIADFAFGQTLEIKEINTDNYPQIKVKFVAKDRLGKEMRTPTLTDVRITEAGNPKNVTLKCAPPGQSQFSLILTIDRSQSMDSLIPGSTTQTRKDIVIKTCQSAINSLPGDTSRWECAITSFSNDARTDTTYNKDKIGLKSVIGKVYQIGRGATDYNAGFLWSCQLQDGALPLTNKAQYKPVIVFLSDGNHSTGAGKCTALDPDTRTVVWVGPIVDYARKNNVTIFAITLGFNPPQSLMDICGYDGVGDVFQSQLTEDDLRRLFQDILDKVGSIGDTPPCEVTWNTDCNGGGTLKLEIPQLGLSKDTTFTIPDKVKPYLEFTPKVIDFSYTTPGTPKTKQVQMAARKNFVDINGPWISDGKFTISDWGGNPPPFTLQRDQIRTLTVQYLTPDKNYTGAKMTMDGSACTRDTLILHAGWIVVNDVHCGASQLSTAKNYNAVAVICNRTGIPVTIKDMRFTSGNFSEFKILSPSPGFTLKPDSCIDVLFEFTPKGLDLRKSDFEVEEAGGTIIKSVIDGTGSGNPEISADDIINFPNADCNNKTRDTNIDVTNSGARDLILDPTPVISGTNQSDFSLQTTAFPMTIKPQDKKQLTVRFQPSGLSGLKTATLIITSNAGQSPTFNINLNGTKDSLGFTASASSLDFGTVCPGEQKDMTVDLNNTGSVTAGVTGTDAVPFTLPVKTFSIPVSGSQTATISLTAPNTEGPLTRDIVFTDDCGVTQTVNVRANVETAKISRVSFTMLSTVGTPKDTSFQICNTSGRDLTISRAQIPDGQFTIINPPAPPPNWTIRAGDCLTIAVRYTPRNATLITTSLQLTGTPCSFSDSAVIIGNPSKATADIVIGPYQGLAGQVIPVRLELQNPFKVTESGANQFKTNVDFEPTVLKYLSVVPNATVTPSSGSLAISNAPLPGTAGTMLTINFEVLDAGQSQSATLLSFSSTQSIGGEVVFTEKPGSFTYLPASATIMLDNFSSAAGEDVNVPIKISDGVNLNPAHHTGINTQLIFDGTLLEPLDDKMIDKGMDASGLRTVEFSNLPVPNVPGGVIHTAKFRGMLGRETSTPVRIQNTTVSKGKVYFTEGKANFELKKVCRSGGARLFDPFGKAGISVIPNPGNDFINVEFEVSEEGNTQIWISDLLGNRITEILNNPVTAGVYSVNLDLSRISNGKYLIIMQTPSQNISKFIEVRK